MKKTIIKILIIAALAVLVGFGLINRQNRFEQIEYAEHLDDVVFSIDGEKYVYRDLAFYIAWQEREVESAAMVYFPSSTKDYWNTHLPSGFVQTLAKDAVLDMAIHDALMYKLAVEAGFELTPEQEADIEGSTIDFWMDLLDGQEEKLLTYTTREAIDELIQKKALAEAYQDSLAIAENHAYVYYDAAGEGYGEIKKEHKIKVYKKLWRQLVLGDITIYHDHVSYINAHEKEKEEP